MPSLPIRNLPDDIYQVLAFRAKRECRSLAQQALVELRQLPQFTASERRRRVLETIQQSLPHPPMSLTPAPEDLVRADRER